MFDDFGSGVKSWVERFDRFKCFDNVYAIYFRFEVFTWTSMKTIAFWVNWKSVEIRKVFVYRNKTERHQRMSVLTTVFVSVLLCICQRGAFLLMPHCIIFHRKVLAFDGHMSADVSSYFKFIGHWVVNIYTENSNSLNY